MPTQADITQRDRDAVTAAIYECLLAASADMAIQAEELQTEACWRGPDAEAWMKWRLKRRHAEGPRREPDPTT